jgi:hypothetical protein
MEGLAVVSALLTALCVVPYLRDVARGTTRPQRTSWLVFAVLSIVAAVSQSIDGDAAGAWLAAGAATGFTAVFLASIRRGEGGWGRADRVSLAVASAGVVASIVVRDPTVAVGAVIAAELSAASMTVRKARSDPASETLATWGIDGVAGVLAIGAVTSPSVAALMYPVHHTFVNGWVATTIVRAQRRVRPSVRRPERIGVATEVPELDRTG